MESILTSIKKMLGISEEDESFDTDVILHINTVLSDLVRLGVGPSSGFMIEDKYAEWTDFVPYDKFVKLSGLVTYVYMRVKLVFDPPTSSAVIEAMEEQNDKFEWELNVTAESEVE